MTMTVALTIVGMNRIGASIGLALAAEKRQLTRTGVDREPANTRAAHKLGALDQMATNLEAAVEKADVVILCVPLEELEEHLKIILPILKPGAVVLDTSPLQVKVFEMVEPLLPADRHFLTLLPTLNPASFDKLSNRVEDASADLFKNSLCIISSRPDADEAALKLAADLATLLGARPYFADPHEVDGVLAAVDQLPRLAAAALAVTAFNQPGWPEARKLAGAAFSSATAPLELDSDSRQPGLAALLNSANALRLLDDLIRELQEMRANLAEGNGEALQTRLAGARANHQKWMGQRASGEWTARTGPQAPTLGETLGGLIGIRKRNKKGEQS